MVSSRPYIYISGWGLKRNIARDDDIISKLATDVKYMGAENLPYVKKVLNNNKHFPCVAFLLSCYLIIGISQTQRKEIHASQLCCRKAR